VKSAFGGVKSAFGGVKSAFGGVKSAFGGVKSAFGGVKSAFGGVKSATGPESLSLLILFPHNGQNTQVSAISLPHFSQSISFPPVE
jgi:hypothetical protein